MNTPFVRTGELKKVESYPQWLQDVIRDTNTAKMRVVHHPLFVAMKEGRLDLASIQAFLIGTWPTIEQFPQYMAQNLLKARYGRSRGEDMARRYLVHNIRVEQKHADHWVEWAKASGVTLEDMLAGDIPAEAHALSHWCGHVCQTESLAIAIAATNYAVEGATGEFSCFICSEDRYAQSFPEDIRKPAMRWLTLHAQYDDDHPWEALDIVATLLGTHPDTKTIDAVRTAVRKSLEYMRMTLDAALAQAQDTRLAA
jgi:pyrroloquinoline quinone (PQQ) biosynthesis protein C